MSAIRPPRAAEKDARNAIQDLIDQMVLDMSGYAEILTTGPASAEAVLKMMEERWRREFAIRGDFIRNTWIKSVSRSTKDKMQDAIARSLGIDMAVLIDEAGVARKMELASVEISSLINTVPGEITGRVGDAVLSYYQQDGFPDGKSLVDYIQDVAGVTRDRAKFWARDQTAKMNSMFTQERMIDAGIAEYIWRTSGDKRVVGAPGGLYEPSKLHGNHYVRNGQIFRWDKPPPDGHPGMAINCRCTPEAIINYDNLKIVR